MKSANKMQQVITQIAQKHGFDLTAPSTHLRLELKAYDPLVIEKIDQQLVRVAHYYMPKGIYMADPEIIFFTGTGPWLPMAVTQLIGGFRPYAQRSATGELVSLQKPALQRDLAEFADDWATNIKHQGWLDKGQRGTLVTPNTEQRFPLGSLLVTPGADEALKAVGCDSAELFKRHQARDYGELDEADIPLNEESLVQLEGRIMSVYGLTTGDKVWVITDGDWGRTTILLPEEY